MINIKKKARVIKTKFCADNEAKTTTVQLNKHTRNTKPKIYNALQNT